LLFLEPSGEQRDRVQNFMGPVTFLATLERIKRNEGTLTGLAAAVAENGNDVSLRLDYASKLRDFRRAGPMNEQLALVRGMLESEIGFDPGDLEARYVIAQKLDALNLKKEARAQVSAIRRLDPQGESTAMRRILLSDHIERGRKSRDPAELMAFLEQETRHDILHEGWKFVGGIESSLSLRYRDKALEHRARQRQAWARAWKFAPADQRALFGRKLAWELYERRDEIEESEKALALQIAERVLSETPEDADLLDTLACCLHLNGRTEEALAALERAIELDPENVRWQLRRREFGGAGIGGKK
ncbi:MAG: tetratricopeptide repeat protein, partial [Planctomycetota bacterium]